MHEAIIIGAGPCGLSTAIELKKVGIEPLILEKGCAVNSVYHYPSSMTFFSTPDKIEIGGVPFISSKERPSREEALKYFRTLAHLFQIPIHTHEEVIDVQRIPDGFCITSENRQGKQVYEAGNVILATGYYDNPNLLKVPGEKMPHVHHYFKDAHPYAYQKAVVIGGRNSAIDTALELSLAGTDVTMVYRKDAFPSSVKAWVLPQMEAAIEHGRVKMIWEAQIQEITPHEVIVDVKGQTLSIPADVVFAMTGYHPNLSLLEKLGVKMDSERYVPILRDSMETSISGVYLAGVVATGFDSTKIFIENGRHHGKKIAEDVMRKRSV
ncbi:thioredoxin reductase (NADPH) [Thermoactinomyces sp. DSM 45891]|uniref:YpdA family putative bacillithiol disulfide reductase n=1 Tax=Thermoactinomyces sp. DSM 45891 TaxID=1761907 RepID=UPI00091A70B6|nr:YpdA family putative bacillithiol disulfide reductase [Thermoactinomyces sp. DSM 45891]SFX01851.1 thioredoxin reductase (NADPH) [Thermoactinomyces sp. DSM 45891]